MRIRIRPGRLRVRVIAAEPVSIPAARALLQNVLLLLSALFALGGVMAFSLVLWRVAYDLGLLAHYPWLFGRLTWLISAGASLLLSFLCATPLRPYEEKVYAYTACGIENHLPNAYPK